MGDVSPAKSSAAASGTARFVPLSESARSVSSPSRAESAAQMEEKRLTSFSRPSSKSAFAENSARSAGVRSEQS